MPARGEARMFNMPSNLFSSISLPDIPFPKISLPGFITNARMPSPPSIEFPTIQLPMLSRPPMPSAFLEWALKSCIFAIACAVVITVWRFAPRKAKRTYQFADVEDGDFVLKRTGSNTLKDIVFLRRRSSAENGTQHILPY